MDFTFQGIPLDPASLVFPFLPFASYISHQLCFANPCNTSQRLVDDQG